MLICSSHLKGAELFWAGRQWPFGSPWSTRVREKGPANWGPCPLIGKATCCLPHHDSPPKSDVFAFILP